MITSPAFHGSPQRQGAHNADSVGKAHDVDSVGNWTNESDEETDSSTTTWVRRNWPKVGPRWVADFASDPVNKLDSSQ